MVNFQIYFCRGFHFHEIVNTRAGSVICAETAKWEAAARDIEREGGSNDEELLAGEEEGRLVTFNI